MSFFDGFDWGGLAGNVVKGAVTALPAIYASNVGANKIAAGNQQAATIAQNTGAANEALIRDQMAQNQAALQQARVSSAPAMARYRTTLAMDPSQLTPAQETAISDAGREIGNRNVLATAGGRAMSRMFADTTGRLRSNAVQSNQARGDQAAQSVAQLSGQNSGVNLNAQGTNALVQNANDVATNVGNAVTSNATAAAEPYGQIANVFANALKDQDRESRYREYKDVRR